MKALVVGGGSIGTRHLNNLKALGVNALAVVEPDQSRRDTLVRDNAVIGFESLEQGLEWSPEFAVIATPSNLHVSQSLATAKQGCHLFIEKPLSHTADGLDKLSEEVKKRNLISLVGCNMRFHPGPMKVKELIARGGIGRPLFARIHTGSYLPEWRPEQDYTHSYSARSALGGGCILDCIHEIDLARWYLGKVQGVFCAAGHLSSLKIETEDVAILILEHSGGCLSEVHLDYVQRTYERGCQVVGEQGSIFWNFSEGSVRWYNAAEKSWHDFPQTEDWQINQMYLDEMKHFLESCGKGTSTIFPISEAIEVTRIALAAKASSQSRSFVSPKDLF